MLSIVKNLTNNVKEHQKDYTAAIDKELAATAKIRRYKDKLASMVSSFTLSIFITLGNWWVHRQG